MKGKVCLITGATAGIGKAVALGLARLGANVIMIARNEHSGKAAVDDIKAQSGNEDICYFIADLSSQKSIRSLAQKVNGHCNKLDVLINNAGTFHTELKLDENGIEMQFSVNYLAGFLLTHLLLDKLKGGPQARIINVASRGHKLGKINFEDINHEKRYDGLTAYTQSKLANVLSTFHLARKLNGNGISVNCVHPGGIRTNIGTSHSKGLYYWVWKLNPFLKSPEEGAKGIIYLASSKQAEGINGAYFYKCKVARSSKQAKDKELAQKLWNLSIKLTSLEIDMPFNLKTY